ncbi:MAG: hypothetical protein E7384_07740 [Ruminococcaceae bacterium]|nr:hypothetical protein [Oscillospiraceae bacterium]
MSQEVKPFKTIEEQLSILRERGLIIDDEGLAKKFLSNLNYYRLSAYTLTLRKDNIFYNNVYFSDVMQIYNFDMELRAALMYLLESIEVSMRAYIGYFHGKTYGALGYYDSCSFEDEERYNKFTNDYLKAIAEYGDKEVFVQHHQDVYDGKFPIWVLVELLTLGTLSRLFKNLPKEIRDEICKQNYGKINDDYIGNWLQGCTILRNICAHRGRLYNRQIPFSLRMGKKDKRFFLEHGISINKASKQLFAYLIVIKKMIPNEQVWNTFVERLCNLITKYPFVRLDYYGFTEDWKELLGIIYATEE